MALSWRQISIYGMSDFSGVQEEQISYQALDDRNALHLIRHIRHGMSYPRFRQLVSHYPISFQEWSQFIHLSDRSLQRYRKEGKRFDSIQTEKILQVIMLFKYGTEVFGTVEKFDEWLKAQNVALGMIRPKELLDSSFGMELVKDALTRIDHGILA